MTNTISSRVKEWRKGKGYSLQLLADCLGVSRDTITRFEEGHISAFNLEHLNILCSKQKEIHVGIVPAYDKKGFESTKTGYIIPMMDCELGYLLGEEGYENRTRAKTDICKATGLSEVAVSALDSRREITIDIAPYKNMGYDDSQISTLIDLTVSSAKRKHSLLLDVIEKLVTSKHTTRMISEFESALNSREAYTNIFKRMEDFMHSKNPVFEKMPIPLHKAWEIVENEGLCILPSDKAEEYFINEASLAFKEILKEMLHTDKEC